MELLCTRTSGTTRVQILKCKCRTEQWNSYPRRGLKRLLRCRRAHLRRRRRTPALSPSHAARSPILHPRPMSHQHPSPLRRDQTPIRTHSRLGPSVKAALTVRRLPTTTHSLHSLHGARHGSCRRRCASQQTFAGTGAIRNCPSLRAAGSVGSRAQVGRDVV